MIIGAMCIASYLDKYAKMYGNDEIFVYFSDGTKTNWNLQRDYIIGRIHGIRDVVRTSELNGDVTCNVYIYNSREVDVHITFSWEY